MSTHNLCFRAKIRKNVYPCTPQFHYIKVGCKGVLITRTCLHIVHNHYKQESKIDHKIAANKFIYTELVDFLNVHSCRSTILL